MTSNKLGNLLHLLGWFSWKYDNARSCKPLIKKKTFCLHIDKCTSTSWTNLSYCFQELAKLFHLQSIKKQQRARLRTWFPVYSVTEPLISTKTVAAISRRLEKMILVQILNMVRQQKYKSRMCVFCKICV
jgi:RecG-like helicase